MSSPDFSFEAFWLVYYLSQPLFADSSSHEVKQLALIVFDKHPREKWILLALMNSNQIKKALQMESPRETPNRWNNNSSCWMELLRGPSFFTGVRAGSLRIGQAAGLIRIVASLFSRLLWSWKAGLGTGQGKQSETHCFNGDGSVAFLE